MSYEIALRDEALLTAKLTFEKKSLDLRRKAGLEIGRRDIVRAARASRSRSTAEDWNVDDVLAQSHKINRQLASIVLEKKTADVDVDVAHNAHAAADRPQPVGRGDRHRRHHERRVLGRRRRRTASATR